MDDLRSEFQNVLATAEIKEAQRKEEIGQMSQAIQLKEKEIADLSETIRPREKETAEKNQKSTHRSHFGSHRPRLS